MTPNSGWSNISWTSSGSTDTLPLKTSRASMFWSSGEAPRAAARGIFTSSAEPAPKQIHLRQAYGGYPFRIHPRPSGRGGQTLFVHVLISIHAPARGAACSAFSVFICVPSFNPRPRMWGTQPPSTRSFLDHRFIPTHVGNHQLGEDNRMTGMKCSP